MQTGSKTIPEELLNIINVSRSIVSEIDFSKLLRKIIRIILESTDIDKVLFLNNRQNTLTIEAEGLKEQGEIKIYQSIFKNAKEIINSQIIRTISETQEIIYIKEIDNNYDLSAWPDGELPKSLLCIPVMTNDSMSGILYLENNSDTVISSTTTEYIKILSQHIAIALENAKIYGDLRAEIEKRKKTEQALFDSEKQYKTLVDFLPDSVVIVKNGRIQYANKAFFKLIKLKEEELPGKDIRSFFHSDYRKSIDKWLEKKQDFKNPVFAEQTIIDKSENEIFVEATALPCYYKGEDATKIIIRNISDRKAIENELQKLYDDQERVIELRTSELKRTNQILYEEIHERRLAEHALEENQMRLRLSLEATQDGLYDFDIKKEQIFLSESYYRLLNIPVSERITTLAEWQKRIHKQDADRIRDFFSTMKAAHQEAYSIEYRINTVADKFIWIQDRGKVTEFDDLGDPSRLIGVVTNIDNRKKSEQALKFILKETSSNVDDNNFFRQFVHSLAEIMELTHAGVAQLCDGKDLQAEIISFWSDGRFSDSHSLSLTGTPGETVISSKEIQFITSDLHELFPNDEYIRKEGIKSYCGVPIFHSDGKIVGLFYAMDKKKMSDTVISDSILKLFANRAGTEIERKKAVDELKRAKDIAENAVKAKNDFLAHMTHDLKTPLNAILGFAQLFKTSDNLTESQQRGVDIILRSGDNLLVLINDILDLAKIEDGKLELIKTKFYLKEFSINISIIMQDLMENESKNYNFEYDENLPKIIQGDEKRIRQILLSIFRYEQKTAVNKTISFRVSAKQDQICFVIEDRSGNQNTAAATMATAKSARKDNFTGLGLAMIEKTAKLMDSSVEIDFNSSGGRRFIFSLKSQIIENTSVQETISFKKIIGHRGKPRKVLVVDDQWNNRFLINKFLKRAGFEVQGAENGEAALEILREFRPDIILMDYFMPIMDGIETCELLQKDKNLQSIPVVALTASSDGDIGREKFKKLCSGIITKPLIADEMFAEIRRLLNIEWEYKGEDDGIPGSKSGAAKSGIDIPSKSFLNDIYNLAMMGDVQLIDAKLEELEKSDSKYIDFIKQVRELTSVFKMKQIRELLKKYL